MLMFLVEPPKPVVVIWKKNINLYLYSPQNKEHNWKWIKALTIFIFVIQGWLWRTNFFLFFKKNESKWESCNMNTVPYEGQGLSGEIKANYFWLMLPCWAENIQTVSQRKQCVGLNCSDAEMSALCSNLGKWVGGRSYEGDHKLMPGFCVRAFMAGFFPFTYALAHCCSDDGWRNSIWEVFVCVWGNLALGAACL